MRRGTLRKRRSGLGTVAVILHACRARYSVSGSRNKAMAKAGPALPILLVANRRPANVWADGLIASIAAADPIDKDSRGSKIAKACPRLSLTWKLRQLATSRPHFDYPIESLGPTPIRKPTIPVASTPRPLPVSTRYRSLGLRLEELPMTRVLVVVAGVVSRSSPRSCCI